MLSQENDKEKREEIRKSRNKKVNEIHRLLDEIKNQRISDQVEEIENSPPYSYRMFKAVKAVANDGKKQSLLIQAEAGMTSDPKEQATIIVEHFRHVFAEEDHNHHPTNNTMSLESTI